MSVKRLQIKGNIVFFRIKKIFLDIIRKFSFQSIWINIFI